jgi:acyl carrier protein
MADRDRTLAIGHVVVAEIHKLLEATGRVRDALGGDDRFDDLGITSLDLVDLVAALNVKLGTNPFRQSVAFTDVRTIADFCRAYQPASTDDVNPTPLGELEETRQRARARRAASQG